MASSSTVLSQHRNLGRGGSRDPSSPYPGETPVVILRVQVLSCQDLQAVDPATAMVIRASSYLSLSYGLCSADPLPSHLCSFVIVSILGNHFQTSVCKRNLNPVYEPMDATFDFPIYASRDMNANTYLGEYSLPIDHWFKETAFAFNDRKNKVHRFTIEDQTKDFNLPLPSALFRSASLPSRPASTARGTMLIKVGFAHPPNSSGLLDLRKTYNALMDIVLGPAVTDKDHTGVVLLEIRGAKDLPKRPNMTRTGWDMDPFVQVSIGEEVKCTRVIRHSLNPVWDEQLLFHVHERDLSLPMRLSVFDWDRFMSNGLVGCAEISIAIFVERAAKKDLNTGLHRDGMSTIREYEIVLTRSNMVYTTTPTITFRAGYQGYDMQRKQSPGWRPFDQDNQLMTSHANAVPQ
ncbi:hypothetical protein BJY52DRAFT_1194882 [Lactarius psammicola]|nr:hypothetical protein BJY52DRAFT_1194882 [Lactarius psammicola]